MKYFPVGHAPKTPYVFNRFLLGSLVVISVSDDVLQIDGFSTNEGDIVAYFAGLSDSEDKDRKLKTLLKLGILAQDSAGTVISTTYVEAAFGRLEEKMAQDVNRILDPNGDFAHLLNEHFGKGGTVEGILDPDTMNTPLNKLLTKIQAGISEIKNDIAMQKGYSEAAKKGTQKGTEFEERCISHICSVAEPYSDTVESTGDTTGDLSASKKGDSVVTIGDTEKKFVLEMKHHAKMSLPEIRRELNGALENRRADYGVLVSRNRDALPKEVGWFNEYDGNKLVCAVSDTDDDEENMWVLTTAYRWARLRITSDNGRALDIDSDVITQGINEIKASLRRMQSVTTQCKNISKATDKIEETMKGEEKKIQGEIDAILHSMKRAG